ncbi:MAG: ribosome maturation factor RimM [Nitrospirota bacterium]
MLITIGKVLKPWGVKGELKIMPLTDFPKRFQDLDRVSLVSPAGKEIICDIASVRYDANEIPFFCLKGYETPEKAKLFNGWFIKIPREQAVPLPEGRYYWFQLIGMDVFSEAGEKLGTITDIFETGSNDVYVVKRGRKEIYIPAIRDIIKQVDPAQNRMVIHLMDGLMQ